MTEKKKCNNCGKLQSIDCFTKNSRSVDNKKNICKNCIKDRDSKRKAEKTKERNFWKEYLPITHKIIDCYQPLFDLMKNEHDKILLRSEMDEIIVTALLVVENINKQNKTD